MSGRRSSGALAMWAEAQRRQQRQSEYQRRQWLAAQREQEQQQRQAQRAAVRGQREAYAAYQQGQEKGAAAKTVELERRVVELRSVLQSGLRSRPFSVDQLRLQKQIPPFAPGRLGVPVPTPDARHYQVQAPSGVQSVNPAARRRYDEAVVAANAQFARDRHAAEMAELDRRRRLEEYGRQYQEWVAGQRRQIRERDEQVDDLVRRLRSSESAAVAEFCSAVLYASPSWPSEFPRRVVTAWDATARQLVINWALPSLDVVPAVARIRYVKTDDRLVEVSRPATERAGIYRDLIAQCILRAIHELFAADRQGFLESVAVNGFVDAISQATGRDEAHCLVTAMVRRDEFSALSLAHVDAVTCLQTLRGQVSGRPDKLITVRPGRLPESVTGDVSDQGDDDDPDLCTMDPVEFERLVADLFQARGFRVMTTDRTGDEGVDVLAEDPDPITGGRIVIQVKRYASTVSPAVVRELFGTVQDKGATKGILVTTSGFGPGSHEFASNKPLTLINGSELVDLLARHGLKGRLGSGS
jgi:restriction system protein